MYYFYFIFPRKYLILNIFLNNFRLYNFIFFVVGVMLKNNEIKFKIERRTLFICFFLFFINGIGGFFIKNIYIQGLLFYISNLLLGVSLLTICIKYKDFYIPEINYLGKESLYFYLYHMIVILITKKFFQDKYYFANIIGILFLIYVIKFFKKIRRKK